MRRARAALFLSLLSLGTATAWPRVARAQPTPSESGPSSNEAAAEALFTEARKLIEGGNVEEGCKKLEASQKLDPGTGTLIHLADCYEKLGRTATSWARFREAAARAARENRPDWESVAKSRAAELEPKLAKLRIDAAPGVSVRRDGDEIPSAALGTPLPIDPGEHMLVASAQGKKPWSGKVTAAPSSTIEIKVPALEEDPNAPPVAGPADREASSGSSLRTIGYVTGAVGLVGITIGAITGLSAISSNNRSKETCPASGVCSDEGARADNESARSSATISTVGFVAGGILLAGGLALVIAAPSSRSPAPASAALRASPNALWLEGTW